MMEWILQDQISYGDRTVKVEIGVGTDFDHPGCIIIEQRMTEYGDDTSPGGFGDESPHTRMVLSFASASEVAEIISEKISDSFHA